LKNNCKLLIEKMKRCSNKWKRLGSIGVIFSIVHILQSQNLENIRQEKWLKVSGNIGAQSTFYNVTGIPARRVPISWMTNGNINLRLKGLVLPFSFQISEQNRDFRQPFNQFGLSPQYKWLTMHAGYRALQFSKYTLGGHLFLGGGIELNPKKFRFGFIYGRFNKAVQEDSARQVYNKVSQFPYAAYDRWGYAVKIGVGTQNNFFDLIYFKAKDDEKSVFQNPIKQNVAPAENAVFGLKTKWTIFKHISLDGDGAISVLNRDLRSLDVEVANPYRKFTNTFIQPKLSSQVYYAGDASINYRIQNFGVGVLYSRVMPDFRSLGAYFMQTDLERVTLNMNGNNKLNTIAASGSIGKEHDNLGKQKEAKTERLIGSLNLNYNPKPAFGISAVYSNFGTSQSPGLKSLNDTVVLNQVTHSITISPRYTLIKEKTMHSFIYNFSNQFLNDRNKINSSNFSMNVTNHTFTYALGIGNFSTDLSLYTVKSKVNVGTNVSNGASLGFGTVLFKSIWNTSLSTSYNINSFNEVSDGYTLQLAWTNAFRLDKHNSINLNTNYLINESLSQSFNQSFNEFTGTIRYNYTF
jgi:hypothetical protein